ncbi:MAG: hypothetical protein JWQ34_2919 [Mucilaginibacter sp.]|nr:hypothetical protein [Mucilaginibacter sp.]
MKERALWYSLIVWFISVVLGPLILSFSCWLKTGSTGLDVYPVFLIMGGIMSAPSGMVLYICCLRLIDRSKSEIWLKLILTPIAIFLTYLPFAILYLLDQITRVGSFELSWPYCTAIIICIWLVRFKIRKQNMSTIAVN